jgi:hypothetical protein
MDDVNQHDPPAAMLNEPDGLGAYCAAVACRFVTERLALPVFFRITGNAFPTPT